jgi:hypothetical protein
MSSQEDTPTICERCREPVDDAKMMVVIQTSDGEAIARHRHCHMLELLDRA